MASFSDIVVFVLVVAGIVFLPYLGSYGVLVFAGLFAFSYLTRPKHDSEQRLNP